jgi:DNA polymerase-3 subunit beta
MKFIVSSSYLLKQLQVLGNVINSSNTLPILDNFLFELDNNELTVSASDLETTMSANLAIDSTSKGSVAVPAKLLLEILKTFPEQPLTLPLKKTARWKSVQTLVNMLWRMLLVMNFQNQLA